MACTLQEKKIKLFVLKVKKSSRLVWNREGSWVVSRSCMTARSRRHCKPVLFKPISINRCAVCCSYFLQSLQQSANFCPTASTYHVCEPEPISKSLSDKLLPSFFIYRLNRAASNFFFFLQASARTGFRV